MTDVPESGVQFRDKVNIKLSKTGKRLITSGLVVGSVYTGTLFYLNEAWYKQYPRSSFHLYNDNKEWLQMDKAGHFWASYQESVAGIKFLKWCGIERYLAEDCGSFLGLILLTPYEILDGLSAGWGFSLGDMYANLTGSLLALTQAKLWHEQRISLKFSSHRENYDNDIFGLADEYYGTGFFDRTLKDYNGQTQWVSVNIWSFCKNARFIPRWLNLAFGYGVNVFDYYDPENYYRQYYFSFDVDFTKIRTGSKVLKTVFDIINCLKVPCPAVEYNKKNKWRFHPFYF